ncbi:MAG: hypothetical protein RI953_2594 [Pseudomonadota bacterium]|jgi:hypothetical protein
MALKMALSSLTGLFVALHTPGCSKQGDVTDVQAPSALAMCHYETSKQCFEYHSSAVLESEKPFCTLANGSWKDSSGCKKEGRVKGCQIDVGGAKAMVFWSYDPTGGPASVEYFCDSGSDIRVAGATRKIVDP